MRLRAAGLILLAVTAAGLWSYWHWKVRPLPPPATALPSVVLSAGEPLKIIYPDRAFASTVAVYQDELFAYLMFDFLRSSSALREGELFLTYKQGDGEGQYRILTRLSNDALTAVARAAELSGLGLIPEYTWRLIPEREMQDYREQTRLFVAAYNLPVRRKLDQIPKAQVRRLVQRFIRYKSTTDPRVRRRMEPIPRVLSREEAQLLAADIITVADFYSIPLGMFLGIGAMENNYMNVRGDLNHTIWKRRPAKDDIVVERRRGRVRVANYSSGVWQITRETLRHAHKLFLADKRDYGQLPERLRPPTTLVLSEVTPDVLTTYAGLLLRDLLDHFDGDVSLAVGAYNGGPGNPNMKYEAGVRAAAEHARNILEQAAALNGETVMEQQWLAPRSGFPR